MPLQLPLMGAWSPSPGSRSTLGQAPYPAAEGCSSPERPAGQVLFTSPGRRQDGLQSDDTAEPGHQPSSGFLENLCSLSANPPAGPRRPEGAPLHYHQAPALSAEAALLPDTFVGVQCNSNDPYRLP